MSNLKEKYKNMGYKCETYANISLEDEILVSVDGYSEFEDITEEDIQNLMNKYSCGEVYIGYGLWSGPVMGEEYSLDYLKHYYFVLQTTEGPKVATPMKYQDKWYLTFEDMYLKNEIREKIIKGEVKNPFVYEEDGTVCLFFSHICDKIKDIDLALLEDTFVNTLLVSMGELGKLINRVITNRIG